MVRKEWTKEESLFIAQNHTTKTIRQLAEHLGRDIHSVGAYLRSRKLARCYEKRPWTKAEVNKLYTYAEKYGAHLIAKKMGRPITEIRRKLAHLRMKTRSEVYSQLRAKELTGYHESQLQRARDVLGQVWMREEFQRTGVRPKIRYTITQKQLDQICEYLKTDTWKHKKRDF